MEVNEINFDAPAVGHGTSTAQAPIDSVWRVLTDFESWPRWNSGVSRLKLMGDVRVGTAFQWKAGGLSIVSRIEALNPPLRIVWSGKTLGIRAIHVWEFEDNGEGTLIRTRESFDGWLAKLLRGPMGKMLNEALAQGAECLKLEAEARHGR